MKLDTLFTRAGKVQSDIRTKTISVTSAFAAAVLDELNNSNRPMSMGVAKLYANEMLRGQWKCNGEPLIFSVDKDGVEHLISGQHRLKAVLLVKQAIVDIVNQQGTIADIWPLAQTTWDSVVVYNVPHDTADTVDTGKSRNHADVLFRDPWVDSVIPEGWNNTVARRKLWVKTLAGAARLVWLIEGGAVVSSAPKFLISEMLDFIQKKHEVIHYFITMILNANDADGDNRGLKMSLPYIAALCYVAAIYEDANGVIQINDAIADKITDFVSDMAQGVNLSKGSPQWALTAYWNALTQEKGSKDRDREWVGPFVKAVRAYLENRSGLKVSDVKLTKKEFDGYTDFPVMFDGWHTLCFERVAAAKAAATEKPQSSTTETDSRPAEDVADEVHPTSSTVVSSAVKRPARKRKPTPAATEAV